MAILEYDRNPQLTADQKIQSLMESVQRAFNEVEQYTPNIQTIEVTPNGGGGTNEGRIIPIAEGGTGEDNQPDALAAILGNSVISIAHGGTGATEALWARVNLGLGEVSTEDTLPVSKGGTGATGASVARSNLGLGNVSVRNIVPISEGGTGATTAEQARANLGISDTQSDIIPISQGGTGATTAEGARDNLLSGSKLIKKTLIFENTSPASSFPAQTIATNLSEYDEIEILYKHEAGANTIRKVNIANVTGTKTYLTCPFNLDVAAIPIWAFRTVTLTQNEIVFGAPMSHTLNATSQTSRPTWLVITQINGLKVVD